jgi:hypothetical protein
MKLFGELRSRLQEERGNYVTEACDRCGQLLGPVCFTRKVEPGVWCSRQCRDGADAQVPGTCKTCKARLPEGKRRGAMYCDDACKQAAHRKTDVRTSETAKLSVTKAPIYAAFSSKESAVRGASHPGPDRASETICMEPKGLDICHERGGAE